MDWQPIIVDGRNETFLVSIINRSNDNFQFNLTNLKELWNEKVEWQAILKRAKDENPIMNVTEKESAVERTIFSPAKHYQTCTSTNGTELMLKTKHYISAVPFHFQWKLTKSGADVFYEEITRKLLVSLLNVQDQRTELFEVIKRKDAEIAQYKIEGAVLARRQLATQPFLKSEFDGKFELMSDSSLFAGDNNTNTIKTMCNYSDLIKGSSAATANVPEKPSPSKIFKHQKKKEENAMRKFQTKRECKIQYESSCELLISDDEMEQNGNVKSDDIRTDAIVDSMQRKEAPKRKLRSKLNL
ncbi:non-homologous end-joining factor 1-like [Bradysia coprophila]|uniref:non-homologous end-joining factor 1-like n=1 Tax=Bradysia coprophila TaxID=38358 RepID=UPI00187D9B23|nr:non-homologous end-joining factor 1-like [Bradysia coprophila]